jgi:hypothetical protein
MRESIHLNKGFLKKKKKTDKSQAWWNIPIIPALRRLRKENCKFKASSCDFKAL